MIDSGDMRIIFEVFLGGLISHLYYKKQKQDERADKKEEEIDKELQSHRDKITRLTVQHDNMGERVDEIREDTRSIKKSVTNLETVLAKIEGRMTNG
jgi:peptidoglycan hydrolase CwlO-like protein